MDKPVVHVFAAYSYDKGNVWGTIHRVSLETAEWMREIGYQIIGPDPHDLIDLAKWEKEQQTWR